MFNINKATIHKFEINHPFSMKHLYILPIMLLAACTTLPKALEPAKTAQYCAGQNEVFVISHGWHTGIALKAADLNTLIPDLAVRFPQAQYYEAGWGDAGFYQANEITTRLTLAAMFWSSGSVMHVVGFNDNPKQFFSTSNVQTVQTSREGYAKLLEFIQSSFKTDIKGNVIREKHGIYADSQFYTGIGTYQMFNTCNKWTAKALYSAGLDISPMFKLTSSSVMNALNQTCIK